MANSYFSNENFINMFFGAIAGAGLGITLGLCSQSFLSPIISAFLSNFPLIPNLIFLPTFTGPFIVTSLAIGFGITGLWFMSDNDEIKPANQIIPPLAPPPSPPPSRHSSFPINDNRKAYFENKRYESRTTFIPTYEPPPKPETNDNNGYSFTPTQNKAEASNSATAKLQTVSFEGFRSNNSSNSSSSSFSPNQTSATTNLSASATTQRPSFGDF